jgi:hypothetical protein
MKFTVGLFIAICVIWGVNIFLLRPATQNPVVTIEQTVNVDKIFVRDPQSFLVLEDNGKKIIPIEIDISNPADAPPADLEIIPDVRAGKSDWITLQQYNYTGEYENCIATKSLEIHIHNSSDINPGSTMPQRISKTLTIPPQQMGQMQ